MRERVRDIAPAAFLALCVMFGGASAAGIVANASLQLIALVVLAWLVSGESRPLVPPARMLVVGLSIFAAWHVVQCIPLPSAAWTLLPGRGIVVRGFALAQVAPGWEPLSLAPDATLAALLALLPGAAMVGLILTATDRARRIAIATLVALAIGAVVLGAAQVLAGADSVLYPYRITNPGKAVGPFANRNHLATLLLCAVPFLCAAVERRGLRRSGAALAGIALLATGVVLTGSDAGLALLAVVLGFVAMRIAARHGVRRATRLRLGIAGALFVAATGATISVLAPPVDRAGAEQRRDVTIPRTLAAAVDHLPFGAGAGSFATVYPAYTDPALASPAFVNHAHSDYAELVLDHGAVGLLCIAAAWLWWLRRLRRDGGAPPTVRAALVAVAVVLLHSLVDYPLRTAAIAAVAAFAAALASGQPPAETTIRRSRRPSRQLSESFDLG